MNAKIDLNSRGALEVSANAIRLARSVTSDPTEAISGLIRAVTSGCVFAGISREELIENVNTAFDRHVAAKQLFEALTTPTAGNA